MASTPSASALSAVLRCRGNIWARNPPTKRPPTSAYSLGLAGGVVRDFPAERSRTNQALSWESFVQGERVDEGRRLTVAFESPLVNAKVQKGKKSRDMNKLYHPKLSQSSEHARSTVPGVQNALVRQLARLPTPNLPGLDKCSKSIRMIKYESNAAHICKIVFVQETSEFPAGVFKVSMASPCLMEKTVQIPSYVLSGWSTLKSTCLSLTALVSQFMFLKLVCGSSSSPGDAPQHPQSQQEGKNSRNNTLQVNGKTPTQNNRGSGQTDTEDRPN
nr:uncharacterized protein LOC109992057 [Labrus bergylta]